MKLTEIQKELLKEEEKDLYRKLGMGMEDDQTRPRLRMIDLMLKTSETVNPTESDLLEVGKEFTVSIDYGYDDKEVFTGILVEEKAVPNLNLTSIGSPLGHAIVGRKIGDDFSYTLEKGYKVNGRILDANIPTIERAREIVKTN